MAARTAFEQLALELINRARLDPAGEAARFGISLNEGLAANTISATAKQPLAGNSALVDAARGHTQHMINTDQFGHSGIGDGDIGTRAIARGYTGFSTLGENISAFSGTNQAVTTVDIHRGLFVDSGIAGRGHRLNILENNFREVGVGQLTGAFRFSPGGAEFQSTLQTQDFGTRGANFFITGVAFTDRDNDSFYDVGEARGSVTVTVKRAAVQTGTDITEAAGGYDIGVATITGSIVRFSGGGLAAPVDVTLAGAQANAKVDLIGTSKIASSVSSTLGTGAKDLKLLGVAAMNGTGNTLANKDPGQQGRQRSERRGRQRYTDRRRGCRHVPVQDRPRCHEPRHDHGFQRATGRDAPREHGRGSVHDARRRRTQRAVLQSQRDWRRHRRQRPHHL